MQPSDKVNEFSELKLSWPAKKCLSQRGAGVSGKSADSSVSINSTNLAERHEGAHATSLAIYCQFDNILIALPSEA